MEKPFPQEEELAQKSARLAELNAQLDVDEKHHEPEMEETPDEESARPSVLAALNEKSDKEEPVKPFRNYSDRDGMPDERKEGRDSDPAHHKNRKESDLRKDVWHGHPQSECVYPQNGIGRILLEY